MLFTSSFLKACVFTYPHQKRGAFKTIRFQKTPLLKPFPKVLVFVSVFGRFSVDDRHQHLCVFKRKRISVDWAL